MFVTDYVRVNPVRLYPSLVGDAPGFPGRLPGCGAGCVTGIVLAVVGILLIITVVFVVLVCVSC